MDFLKIVLDGYIDSNSRQFLSNYFVREHKKALVNNYLTEEFFSGCKSVIQKLAGVIEKQLLDERHSCHIAIGHLKSGTMKFAEPNPSITYEEQCKRSLEICEEQLKGFSMDSFCVNLDRLNGVYRGNLWNKDIQFISEALENARNLISLNELKQKVESVISLDIAFVESVLNGIRELKNQDLRADCIKLIKKEGKFLEEPFRNWFKTYFAGQFKSVNAEPEKGLGKIDLKIEDSRIGTRIIEFKGWWNSDKKNVANQIINYLTDFENVGYVIIVNHTRKSIDNKYIELIKSNSNNYVHNSFKQFIVPNSDYKYYYSQHTDSIRTKQLYHFLLNVF